MFGRRRAEIDAWLASPERKPGPKSLVAARGAEVSYGPPYVRALFHQALLFSGHVPGRAPEVMHLLESEAV